jgi:hypothetical protein
MLTKEQCDVWAKPRGYSLHMRSGSDTLTYNKSFDKYFLALTFDLVRKEMVLQAFPGFFTLSSGKMQAMHPNFDELFEARMVRMMNAIENYNQ